MPKIQPKRPGPILGPKSKVGERRVLECLFCHAEVSFYGLPAEHYEDHLCKYQQHSNCHRIVLFVAICIKFKIHVVVSKGKYVKSRTVKQSSGNPDNCSQAQ